jgi:hypothetical protein
MQNKQKPTIISNDMVTYIPSKDGGLTAIPNRHSIYITGTPWMSKAELAAEQNELNMNRKQKYTLTITLKDSDGNIHFQEQRLDDIDFLAALLKTMSRQMVRGCGLLTKEN